MTIGSSPAYHVPATSAITFTKHSSPPFPYHRRSARHIYDMILHANRRNYEHDIDCVMSMYSQACTTQVPGVSLAIDQVTMDLRAISSIPSHEYDRRDIVAEDVANAVLKQDSRAQRRPTRTVLRTTFDIGPRLKTDGRWMKQTLYP
jgi:hypothetical protein